MKNVSSEQYQLIISTVAKIPCEPARPVFLAKLDELLSTTKGKVSDEQFIDALNRSLASFEPGAYHLDQYDGQWRAAGEGTINMGMTLKEAAERYQLILQDKGPGTYWPPIPPSVPLTPEQQKAQADEVKKRFPNMSLEEAAAAYARTLRFEDNEEYREPVAPAKVITQSDLVEPDTPPPAKPAEPPPVMLTDRVEATTLERDEYSVEPLPEGQRAKTRSEAMREVIALARRKRGRLKPF